MQLELYSGEEYFFAKKSIMQVQLKLYSGDKRFLFAKNSPMQV